MSSIKQVKTRHDSEGFRVHYGFKTREAACHFLFLSESERFLAMMAKEKRAMPRLASSQVDSVLCGKKVFQCENGAFTAKFARYD
ncbi:hypothetical protein [Candidatus Arsenophonus triatominarum]|uniref:hypothetical protein n=1 Tax=Candidatus Arsenophonus triatominarum TaxID=57911 RepID=UPI0007C482F5|nr:hypothetical protein [Candidatus Arsenophonus triatominarum]